MFRECFSRFGSVYVPLVQKHVSTAAKDYPSEVARYRILLFPLRVFRCTTTTTPVGMFFFSVVNAWSVFSG